MRASSSSAAVTSATLPSVRISAKWRSTTSVRAWILVVLPPRVRPIACARARLFRRTLGLDVGAVDRGAPGHRAWVDQGVEKLQLKAPRRPAVGSIVDRGRRAVVGWAVAPAAPVLEHVKDAGYYSPVVNTPRARLVPGQVRLDRRSRLVRQAEQRHAHVYRSRRHNKLRTGAQLKPLIEFGPEVEDSSSSLAYDDGARQSGEVFFWRGGRSGWRSAASSPAFRTATRSGCGGGTPAGQAGTVWCGRRRTE